MEVFIADVWREVLKIERVGLRDNFFDLGGHSLLSMQVAYRIEKKTGRKLNPRSMVFQNLEQIAAECGDGGDTEAAGSPARSAAAAPPTAGAASPPRDTAPAAARPTPLAEPAKPLTRKLFDALKSKVFRS
jgi:acyl carrier protein